MKNTILFFGLLLAGAAQAQTTEQTEAQTTAATETATAVVAQTAKVTSDNITPAYFLPALGQFTGTEGSTENLTVTVDEQNLGIVWVEGLAAGKFKALLKQSPATYKIPAARPTTPPMAPPVAAPITAPFCDLVMVLQPEMINPPKASANAIRCMFFIK